MVCDAYLQSKFVHNTIAAIIQTLIATSALHKLHVMIKAPLCGNYKPCVIGANVMHKFTPMHHYLVSYPCFFTIPHRFASGLASQASERGSADQMSMKISPQGSMHMWVFQLSFLTHNVSCLAQLLRFAWALW